LLMMSAAAASVHGTCSPCTSCSSTNCCCWCCCWCPSSLASAAGWGVCPGCRPCAASSAAAQPDYQGESMTHWWGRDVE
jgi:hypothetical protein